MTDLGPRDLGTTGLVLACGAAALGLLALALRGMGRMVGRLADALSDALVHPEEPPESGARA